MGGRGQFQTEQEFRCMGESTSGFGLGFFVVVGLGGRGQFLIPSAPPEGTELYCMVFYF